MTFKKPILFLFLVMTILNVKTLYAQMNRLNLSDSRVDTINGVFLSNFEYDVLVVYFDGIEVYNGILFSSKESGNARNGFKVFYNELINREIRIDVVLYERNQKASLRYNPLWHEWNEERDTGFYYKVVKRTKHYTMSGTGNTVAISLEYDESGKKYPVIELNTSSNEE